MSTVENETRSTSKNATVAAGLPLALLETVRSHDLPSEVLEAEDLTASLPRRFGLSDVVLTQIRRYEGAKGSGRRVPVSELKDLLRLVLRRPDAPVILLETGRRVARNHFEGQISRVVRASRVLPDTFFLIPVRRAIRRLLRSLAGGSAVQVRGKPVDITINDSLTGTLDTTACLLYTGAFEETVRIYGGRPRRIIHHECRARGDATCKWLVEPDAEARQRARSDTSTD
jgi:hypothetical protein